MYTGFGLPPLAPAGEARTRARRVDLGRPRRLLQERLAAAGAYA